MKVMQKILFIAAFFAVSACSTTFRSDVATFHELTVPGGERVMLTPMDPDKKDSLEYRQYAGVLAGHLKSYGYVETGDAAPQLIAGFDLTINDGREKLRTRALSYDPFYWNSYWAWGRHWNYPFSYPFAYRDTQIVAGTVYTVTLTLELRKPDGQVIFEGRAETETRTKTLPEVMPFLADALFQDFPGKSGVTRRVSVTPPETE